MQERDIFIEALQRETPPARAAYLDDACAHDTDLRQRIERLLLEHESQKSFILDAPAAAAMATGAGTGATADDHFIPLDPPTFLAPPGTVIGRYKLLESIGEGGHGTVFMAEQTSPVQRKVALKIIKAGMDTRQVIARFEAERQALALMDHPNIAKVFDAGTTDTGRLYFVMELVKGVPITKYCDEHRIEPRQRLELFTQVCQAVQHAHQKGIIHRDLKPTNVLVAQYDGKPVPKVIDFGVAKATGQQLTEKTMFTSFGDVIGTLEYMSPEQAEVNQLDVDTRSDIYSLGVLLYELLTGTTPLEHKRVLKAGLLEMLRVVREEEPPRPSMRLSTSEQLPSISASRGVEPRKLSGLVKGELDWIVMKALEKDRGRRYETANGLATDVQRYLRDEAVHACPPSSAYRFRKFARRNRVALGVAFAIVAGLLLLVAGLAASNRVITASRNKTAEALREKELALAAAKASAERAEAQRQRAEENFGKARVAVRDLMFSPAMGHDEWAQLPAALRKKFAEKLTRFYASLLQQDSADPSLRYETAVGLRSLGFLQERMGDLKRAEELLRQSIDILEGLHRESPGNPDYRQQLAWSGCMLCQTLRLSDRGAEAESVAQRSIDLYERLMVEQPKVPAYSDEVLVAYRGMGEWLKEVGRLEEAERAFQRAIAIHEDPARAPADHLMTRVAGARVYFALAEMRMRAGRTHDAANLYSRGLKANPNDVHWCRAAALYLSIGDDERYRGACRELLDRFEKLAAQDAEVAEPVIRACVLAPDSVADFSRIERLAERWVTGTERIALYPNFVLAKGLTDYRGGRHEQAVEWLQRFAPTDEVKWWNATAFAGLAMAHHQLGHADQARASLASARAITGKKPKDTVAVPYPFEWLPCEILCREAERLMGAASPPRVSEVSGIENKR